MDSKIWKVDWDNRMSVGIADVDEDHKRFISLINGLNRAILERMGLHEIKTHVHLIVYDAAQHFRNEEALFKQCNYPQLEAHASIHDRLRHDFKTTVSRLAATNLEPEWITAGLEVKYMLLNHLLIDDMRYRDYFITHAWNADTPPGYNALG